MTSRWRWVWSLWTAVAALALLSTGCEDTPAVKLRSIALDPVSVTLHAGSTDVVRVRATGAYDDGTSREVTALAAWASSATNVVAVDSANMRGTVRAAGNAVGAATVTAVLDGITSAPAAVTVLPSAVVTGLTLDPNTASMAVGSARTLRAMAAFADGRAVDVSSSATWTTSDAAIVTVERGVVTSVHTGSATVGVTYQGASASAMVTVTDATLVRIELDPRAASAAVGTTVSFHATGVYSDGTSHAIESGLIWISTVTSIAMIGGDGVAHAAAPGTVTIRAEFGSVQGEASLVVTSAALRAIAVMPASVTVPVGGSATFAAVGSFSDGTTQNLSSLVGWTSADPSVATVSSLGQVLGLRAGGPVAIRATLGMLSGSADVTVTGAFIQRVEVTPTAPPDLPVGLTQPFRATAYLSDGATLDVTSNNNLTWSSTAPAIATVSNAMDTKGSATAVAEGVAGLSAAWNDGVRPAVVSATVPLHVTAARLVSLELSPASASVPAGFTVAFRAIGHFSDNRTRDLSTDASVTWSTEMASVATVSNAPDSRGLATAVAAGTAAVRAQSGAVSATASLRVTDVTLTSIAVSPASAIVTRGSSQPFTATGTFSDATTMDVTRSVTWESSDTTRALVSNLPSVPGIATTPGSTTPGAVSIRARRGAIMGSATLTVSTALTLQRIEVTVLATAIPVGLTARAHAMGTYTDGVSAPLTREITDEVLWTITGGATVSNAAGSRGLVTGVAPELAYLQATLGGVRSAPVTLTVTACRFARVQITQGDAVTLARGANITLQARAFYDAACLPGGVFYDVTEAAGTTWSSSNVAVATVSNAAGARGLVVAAQSPATPAYSDVQVFYGTLSATTRVTVTSACVMRVDLATSTTEVPVGIDVPFTATATMSDNSRRNVTADVSLTTSDAAIAAPGAPGVVRTNTPGAVTVTATVRAPFACGESVRSDFALTVSGATLTGLSLSAPSVTLARGETASLTAIGTYSNGRTYDVTSVAAWRSANPSVATVSAGRVSASAAGDGIAVITAGLGRLDANVTVTVSGRTLVRIEAAVDPGFSCGRNTAGAWPVGVVIPMAATGYYSDGTSSSLRGRATWRSSLDALAVDPSTGEVSARAPGTAQLVAQVGSVASPAVAITAAASTLTRLDIAPATGWTMPAGAQQRFVATGTFDGFAGSCPMTAQVAWTATATAPATLSIDPSGVAVAGTAGAGPANVRAALGTVSAVSAGAVSGTCVNGLVVVPATLSGPAGVSVEATAYLLRSDGARAPVTATWSTSDLALATVSNGTDAAGTPTALIRPLAAGTATITASVTPAEGTACPGRGPTFTAATTLTVTTGVLTEIFVDCAGDPTAASCNFGSATRPSYPAGLTVQCVAFGRYSDGPALRDITDSVAWASNALSIVSVGSSSLPGRLRTNAPGAAVITATLGAVSAARDVEVNAATVALVRVSPALVNLPVGFTQWFSAEATYSVPGSTRACVVTHLASWSSSSPAVASVVDTAEARGRAQTLSAGTTSVSATLDGRTGVASVTVNAATLTALQISPPAATMGVGVPVAFFARGVYSDGSTRDVTDTAVWSTSDASIATIANGPFDRGVMTPAAVGTVTVRAAIVGVVGTTTATVTPRCVEGLVLSPGQVNVPVGVPVRWSATARWSDGSASDVTSLVGWSSSNPAAMPAPSGAVSIARAAGRALITASMVGCRGTALTSLYADVNNAALASLVVRPSGAMASVPVNLALQMRAVGTYSDRTVFDVTESIQSWGVGNAAVASVSSRGVVTGLTVGASTVTATQGAISGSGPVAVTSAVVTSIAVRGFATAGACRDRNDAAAWVSTGFTAPAGGFYTSVRAIGTLSDGTTQDLTEASMWWTDTPSVASISNAPGHHGEVVTGLMGTVTFTANYGALRATLALSSASATLGAMTINPSGPDPVSLAVGNSAQLELLGDFGAAGRFCIDGRASWESSAPSIATADKGLITALTPGAALMTARVGSVSDTIAVAVGSPSLVYVEVQPRTASMRVGDAAQLRAIAHYSDLTANDVTANPSTVWSASDVTGTSVAAVDSGLRRGLVTALSAGVSRLDACIGAICAASSTDRSALVTVSR